MELTQFLPKYARVQKSEHDVLNPYPQEDFYNVLNSKREFIELKYNQVLVEDESTLKNKNDAFKHQLIVSRFLSSKTPYNFLLLAHDMGTGKSGSAFLTTELLKKEGAIKHAYILSKGHSVLDNLKEELIRVESRYRPEGEELFTGRVKTIRRKKMYEGFYTFESFYIFANKIKDYNDKTLTKLYSNSIFVMDEVHNIRIKDTKDEAKKKEEIEIYAQFFRLFHLVKNCKILLMSGTVMKDSPDEIATILNLVLPLDRQMPVKNHFMEEFMEKKSGYHMVRNDKKEKLMDFFKGGVSFLKADTSSVSIEFQGELQGGMNFLKTFPVIMSDYQTDLYKIAFETDMSKDKTGIYSHSRQATLCVSAETAAERPLTELKNYSCVYDSLLQSLENSNDKSCFVYSQLVSGSGLQLLARLLRKAGFSRATRNSGKGKYYLLLTSDQSASSIKESIALFNKPQNFKGEYIKVILGSKIISEGITLKNVQRVHILTPHWNYSETAQAIARTIRVGSHETLIKEGIVPKVEIFQYTAIPNDRRTRSIDLERYKLSESKDISIKNIEYLLKISSVDCYLLKGRNLKSSELDRSRDCQYELCDYKCPGEPSEKEMFDDITFNLFYSAKAENVIKNHILNLFRKTFKIPFTEVVNRLNMYPEFVIYKTVNNFISNNEEICNKFNVVNYLRIDKGFLYLTDSILAKNSPVEYAMNPKKTSSLSFSEITQQITNEIVDLKILILQDLRGEEFDKRVVTLPQEIQEFLVEQSIIAHKKNITTNLSKNTLRFFKDNINGDIIQFGNVEKEYVNGKWVLKERKSEIASFEKRAIKKGLSFIGLVDPNGKFSIKRISANGVQDARKKTTGENCQTIKSEPLRDLLLELNPPFEQHDISKTEMKKYLANKNITTRGMENDQIEMLYHWLIVASKGKTLCPMLKQSFENLNLLANIQTKKKNVKDI